MTPLEKLNLEVLNIAGGFQRTTAAMAGAAQTIRAVRDLGDRIVLTEPQLKANAEQVLKSMHAWQATIAPFEIAVNNLLKEFQNGLVAD